MGFVPENCPCMKCAEFDELIKKHEEQLHKGDTTFAVINTKLNVVIGVLAAVGTAICGVIVKMIF